MDEGYGARSSEPADDPLGAKMKRGFVGRVERRLGVTALMVGFSLSGAAQQPMGPNIDAQREAMKKLSFLVGHWSGPVTVTRGPGEPLHLTQTEDVEYKLEGLVMLIEGRSTGTDGKAQFEALATIAYDDVAKAYRIRAYNGGRYLDTELTVHGDGFAWGFDAGPAKVRNTMHLTAKGEWQETTEVAFGSTPPHRSVEMLLEHEQ
jgi:hypothetical protein